MPPCLDAEQWDGAALERGVLRGAHLICGTAALSLPADSGFSWACRQQGGTHCQSVTCASGQHCR